MGTVLAVRSGLEPSQHDVVVSAVGADPGGG